jgi:hypothetical protein
MSLADFCRQDTAKLGGEALVGKDVCVDWGPEEHEPNHPIKL